VLDIFSEENARRLRVLVTRVPGRAAEAGTLATLWSSQLDWLTAALVSTVALGFHSRSEIRSLTDLVGMILVWAMVALGVRIVVFFLRLALTFLVAVPAAVVMGALALVARLTRSARLSRWNDEIAWLVRAIAIGTRGEVVRLRAPRSSGPRHQGTARVGPTLLVSEGKRGDVRVGDAVVEPFAMTLASGEQVLVRPTVGKVVFGAETIAEREAQSAEHPYFTAPTRLVLRDTLEVSVRGGTFAAAIDAGGLPGGFRDSPKMRVLEGTEDAPLEIEVRAAAAM